MIGPILKGEEWRFTPIDKGLGEFFFEQAEKFGSQIFQIDGDTGNQQTYEEISQQAIRTAIYLKNLGIKEKNVVLLCCKNSPHEMVAVLAALYLGAYVSAVDADGSILETKYFINLVEPKVIIMPSDRAELIEQSIRDIPNKPIIISVGDTNGKYTDVRQIGKNNEELKFRPIPQKGLDTCAILFSSGTTSAPKGICITNTTLLNGALALIQQNWIKPGCMMHFTKFNWISSWILTGAAIVSGTKKVISNRFNGGYPLKLIHEYKVTHVFTTKPLVYEIISLDENRVKKYNTSSLFSFGIGGAPLDPNQILKLRKYLPHTHVNFGYGSTEGYFMTTHNFSKIKESVEKVSSSGIVIPGVQLKVVNLDTGRLLGPNEKGEIRVQTKFITNGFYKLPNKCIFDPEGWYKTGDEGYYDQDGYIYITDRISSTFKYITHQISPTLLEFAILQHPKVAEAVVFGVPHELDTYHPAACIVVKPGVTATVEEIIDFVDGIVSEPYRLRGGLMILDEIPKLSSGKYQTRLVKDNFIKINQLNHS